jgi:hypothetical protein
MLSGSMSSILHQACCCYIHLNQSTQLILLFLLIASFNLFLNTSFLLLHDVGSFLLHIFQSSPAVPFCLFSHKATTVAVIFMYHKLFYESSS